MIQTLRLQLSNSNEFLGAAHHIRTIASQLPNLGILTLALKLPLGNNFLTQDQGSWQCRINIFAHLGILKPLDHKTKFKFQFLNHQDRLGTLCGSLRSSNQSAQRFTEWVNERCQQEPFALDQITNTRHTTRSLHHQYCTDGT